MQSPSALLQQLPESAQSLLNFLSEQALRQDLTLYLVGGLVRDLLLDTSTQTAEKVDIDIALEGDAGAFLGALDEQRPSGALEGRIGRAAPFILVRQHSFPKYGTAKAIFERGVDQLRMAVDFARCRAEQYADIAAAPQITWATVEQDLWRRDFSINAIALRLGQKEPVLLDPCQGVPALKEKKLEILHADSFRDDPARLIRGCRFVHRFGFRLSSGTAAAAAQATEAGWLRLVPPYRRFDELRKAMHEPSVAAVLADCAASGFLAQVHPLLLTAYERLAERGRLDELNADTEATARMRTVLSTLREPEKGQV